MLHKPHWTKAVNNVISKIHEFLKGNFFVSLRLFSSVAVIAIRSTCAQFVRSRNAQQAKRLLLPNLVYFPPEMESAKIAAFFIALALVATLSTCNKPTTQKGSNVLIRRLEKPKTCKIIPLASRKVIKADAVFSATVLSLLLQRQRPPPIRIRRMKKKKRRKRKKRTTWAAKVVVKRVFDIGQRADAFHVGQEVIVEGLGNPKICVSRPTIGDTRIFFVDNVDIDIVRLRSSLLRISPRNLRRLRQFETTSAGEITRKTRLAFYSFSEKGRNYSIRSPLSFYHI